MQNQDEINVSFEDCRDDLEKKQNFWFKLIGLPENLAKKRIEIPMSATVAHVKQLVFDAFNMKEY